MAIRLVVIDGHTLIRYGLSGLVNEQHDIEIVGETGSAAEAAKLVMLTEPHVVTIDVALPDGDGLSLARSLRDRHRELGIVMLTSLGEDDVLFRAVDSGASAFVSKTAPTDEVLSAIRHAAVAATSFTATGLGDALARRRELATRFALSPREREVLFLLRDGLSIPLIASRLYLSPSTAKTYVARLYEKLGASSRAQALMNALRHNLIDFDEQPVA